jgi:hypothetical protein
VPNAGRLHGVLRLLQLTHRLVPHRALARHAKSQIRTPTAHVQIPYPVQFISPLSLFPFPTHPLDHAPEEEHAP